MWFEERSLSNLKMSSLTVMEYRDLWSFKAEFLIVALSYVFATNNLLVFPRLLLENGGLAFVAAYGASLLLISLPLIILELSVGQLTGRAPVQALYNICPCLKGVGVSMVFLSLITIALMSRYLSWLLLFVFHLFWTVIDERPGLPWLDCQNYPELQTLPCVESAAVMNSTAFFANPVRLATLTSDSALSQFIRALENPSTSIAEIGHFQLHLLVALGIASALLFIAICFGVRWLSKVVVFTFMTPVCLLLILLARVLFLSGAVGMFERIYEMTDWERLADYMVWKAAIEQAILATGVGFGVFITIASYCKRSSNLVRDSFVIVFGHALLTALQLAVVFGLVGFVSFRTGLTPLEVVGSGETQLHHLLTYLSFVPSVKLFTGIFLFACVFIVLNILYLLALNILATIEDAIGSSASRCCPRFSLAFLICLFACASGIFFTTQAGRFAYELAAGYLKYSTLWIILAFEILAVTWFYCAHTLGKDLKTMLKSKCCWCLGHSILFLTYLLIGIPIAIAVLNLMNYDFGVYSQQIRNWTWSEWIGWAIAVVPLLPIVLFLFYSICYNLNDDSDVSKGKKFRYAFKSPMRYEIMKNSGTLQAENGTNTQTRAPTDTSPRYTAATPGYTLLPQNEAPLAEPENYNDVYSTNNVREIPIRRV